jgi:hypothetical protein
MAGAIAVSISTREALLRDDKARKLILESELPVLHRRRLGIRLGGRARAPDQRLSSPDVCGAAEVSPESLCERGQPSPAGDDKAAVGPEARIRSASRVAGVEERAGIKLAEITGLCRGAWKKLED